MMKKLTCNKLCNLCDKATLVLLCVLMADCAVMGSGRAITIGPLGLRMVLFGLMMVASVPLIIQQLPRLIKVRVLWVLAAFALWLGLETLLGIRNGNNRALMAGDLKGFAYFVAVIPVLCVLNTKKRIHTLMKVVMYANAVLALAALFLLLLYNANPNLFNELAVMDIEHHITMFAAVSSRVPRLFFKSTPYFITTCAFPIYFAITEKKAVRYWLYPLITGLSLFAMLLSYTRSVYLAIALAAVFMLLVFFLALENAGRKQMAKSIALSALAFLLLIGACSAIFRENLVSHAFNRLGLTFQGTENPDTMPSAPTEDPTTDTTAPTETKPDQDKVNQHFQNATIESDKIRSETTAELAKHIRSSPIWGHGLGKALEVRKGAANEYIYQDLIMKTGIIGLLLFFAPMGLLLVSLVKHIRKRSEKAVTMAAWITVLLGFMAFSYFNPYMNAALGVLFYCCTIGVVCALDK